MNSLAQAVLLLLLLCGLTACDRAQPSSAEPQSIRPARVFQVVAQGATIKHEFVGRVEAAQVVDVSFEVAGPLALLPVLEGQSISAGDLVAALDPTDFNLALREAEVQLKLASQDLERKRKLLMERGISESIVDDAQALFDLRKVRMAQAREALADTRILAPFDAYVARRYVDNHVNVRVGDKIARLNDLQELHVVANVPGGLLATTTPDQVVAVRARFDFIPDTDFALQYRENSGDADSVAQTYEITFAMPRPERWNILPGMTASVEIELTTADDGLDIFIPTTALVASSDKRFYVWVYDPLTHNVERRTVEVGSAAGDGVPVRSGLSGGELVVATGASQLQDGMQIRPLGDPVTEL